MNYTAANDTYSNSQEMDELVKRLEAVTQERDAFCAHLSVVMQARDMLATQLEAAMQERDMLATEREAAMQARDTLATQLEAAMQERNLFAQQIKEYEIKVVTLEAAVSELKRRLGLNSQNSSKPPSSDGYAKPKPKSRRERSGKKRGGQKGHEGSNMEVPHEPDEVLQHMPEKCQNCPHLKECQENKNFVCSESRYVVDVEIRTKVTEHQTMSPTHCPLKEQVDSAQFPEDVKAHVQYGDSVTVLVGLLNTYGAISYERIHVILGGLMGVSLSTGTLVKMVGRCAAKVAPTLEEIRDLLTQNTVNHYDETGVRVNGHLYWVHNSSSADYTYQTLHKKRGSEGIEDNGVLRDSSGVAVHDCWGSYWYIPGVKHALCCAHLLRELEGILENTPDHTWAQEFAGLLLRMKAQKERDMACDKENAGTYHLHKFSREYDRIMQRADTQCPPPPAPVEKKRGRKKLGKERSLLERLIGLKEDVCRFFTDYSVPFDNNQAERDLRNLKTKCKVSGCFRSEEGAKDHLSITSFISTGMKAGITSFNALKAAFRGMGKIVTEKCGL